MDRQTALRALGLPPRASGRAVRRGFGAMRDHLMARARSAGSEREAAERLAELAALEAALARDLRTGRRRTPAGRALQVAAGAVLLLAVAWGLGRGLAPGGPASAPPAGPPEPAPVASPAPEETVPPSPARIAVTAPVDGARFSLETAGGERLLDAAADGEVHTLDPTPGGPLALLATHPDCGAGDARVIELPGGELRSLEVQPCPDTGWLVVRSNVAGDAASAGDRDLGPTSPERHPLPVGTYPVRVEKPGYRPWRTETAIEPGQVVVLHATLRPEPRTGASDEARDAAREEAERTAADITGDKGGTRGWFESVSTWMVAHHDRDGTGLIDAPTEVASISCQTWQALEISYETGQLGAPMSRLYGFDGSRWVPGALGFDVRVRDQAYERMRDCGLR